MPRSRSTASSGAATPGRSAASITPRRCASQLEGLTIDLPARAGDDRQAVRCGHRRPTSLGAIKKAGGPPVDKRAVQIAKPIKTVGTHTVGVKLHDAVTAHVRIVVVQQA